MTGLYPNLPGWCRPGAPVVSNEAYLVDANVALDRMIPQLAATRDRVRAETLLRLFGPEGEQ